MVVIFVYLCLILVVLREFFFFDEKKILAGFRFFFYWKKTKTVKGTGPSAWSFVGAYRRAPYRARRSALAPEVTFFAAGRCVVAVWWLVLVLVLVLYWLCWCIGLL